MILTKEADAVKTCTKCGKEKPLIDFYRNRKNEDGHQSRCKICLKEYDRQYNREHVEERRGKARKRRRENPNRQKQYYRENGDRWRGYWLKQYGITLDDYNRMFIEQKGCCAICGRHQSEFKRRLHVDHDHKINRVRGLLCVDCNFLLGQLERIEEIKFAVKADIYRSKNDDTDTRVA